MWRPKTELMDRETLTRLQLERIRRQLRRIRGHARFYERKLEENWEPATLEQFTRLPVTTAAELVAEFEATGDPAAGRVVVAEDEVDTILVPPAPDPDARPIFGFLSLADRAAQVEALTRYFCLLGIRGGQVVHVLSWGQEPLVALYAGGLGGTGTYSAPSVTDYIHAHVVGMELATVEAGRTIATARLLHPRGIFANLEHLSAMQDVLAEDSRTADSLGYELLVTRETTLPAAETLKELADGWGAVVLPMLDCAEAGFMALGCPDGDGLHAWDDLFYVEVTDESGLALPDGEAGLLTVTSLVAGAAPLLRYQTDVVTALDRAPCSCGRTHTRLRPEV